MTLFIVFALVGIMLTVCGGAIRFKKAYMIISGINTSTPERRAKMDLDAICKVIGNTLMAGGLMWIAAGLCYMLGFEMALFIMIPAFAVLVLGSVVYVQRYDHNNRDENGRIKRSAKIAYIISGIVSLAILIFIGYTMLSGMEAPTITIEGDIMSIKSSFGCDIGREDITSVTLVDTVPPLYRTNAYGMGSYIKGEVSCDELGAGRAYIKADKPPFIFITLGGSRERFLYINQYDKEQTSELYSRLSKWIENNE